MKDCNYLIYNMRPGLTVWLAVKDKIRSRPRNSCLFLRKPEETTGIVRKQRELAGNRGKGRETAGKGGNSRERVTNHIHFLEFPKESAGNFPRDSFPKVASHWGSFLPATFPAVSAGFLGNPKESFLQVPLLSWGVPVISFPFLRFPAISLRFLWFPRESGGNVRKVRETVIFVLFGPPYNGPRLQASQTAVSHGLLGE